MLLGELNVENDMYKYKRITEIPEKKLNKNNFIFLFLNMLK